MVRRYKILYTPALRKTACHRQADPEPRWSFEAPQATRKASATQFEAAFLWERNQIGAELMIGGETCTDRYASQIAWCARSRVILAYRFAETLATLRMSPWVVDPVCFMQRRARTSSKNHYTFKTLVIAHSQSAPCLLMRPMPACFFHFRKWTRLQVGRSYAEAGGYIALTATRRRMIFSALTVLRRTRMLSFS